MPACSQRNARSASRDRRVHPAGTTVSETEAGSLFSGIVEAINGATPALLIAAAALEVTDGHPVPSGAQGFTDFILELGREAGPGAAAAALRSDLMLRCAVCAELTTALDRLPAPVIQYLSVYCQPSVTVLNTCERVIADAIAGGEDPASIVTAARRPDPVVHAYWQSIASA